MKAFRELEKLLPDQQQKLITHVLKETLPAAKDDLSIDELHPLLCQSGVLTCEEATELMGIFTAQENRKSQDCIPRYVTKERSRRIKEVFENIVSHRMGHTQSHETCHALKQIISK